MGSPRSDAVMKMQNQCQIDELFEAIVVHYGPDSKQVAEAETVLASMKEGFSSATSWELLDSIYQDGSMWHRFKGSFPAE